MFGLLGTSLYGLSFFSQIEIKGFLFEACFVILSAECFWAFGGSKYIFVFEILKHSAAVDHFLWKGQPAV